MVMELILSKALESGVSALAGGAQKTRSPRLCGKR